MADTLTLAGLNNPIRDLSGTDVVLRDADGNPLEDEQQLTLGNILLGLITRMKAPEEARKIIRARRVGEAIAAAMDGEGEYVAANPELTLLRQAATDNGPGYTVPVLGYVMLALGMENGEA